MAATSTLLLTLLQHGDHIICGDVVYGGTVRLLREVLNKFGIDTSFIDTTNLNVTYPGLTHFPQHQLAKQQQADFGGLLTFELKGGFEPAVKFVKSLKLCALAENLGSVETLITHPASMTHGPIPKEIREKIGITDGLIRLSVGLEDPNDIILDLEQALSKCQE